KKTIVIGISIFVILIGFLAIAGLSNTLSISGVNTLSISQAQLQSSNSYLSGKAWLLTFSSGGLGQHYTGTFSPSDVQSATSDSTTTTKPFTINVDYSDQTCNYAIQQTSLNKPIYDVQEITWTSVPFVAPCNPTEAKEKGLSTVLYTQGFLLTCHAIGYNTQSPIGNLQNPNLESEFTISINAEGNTATKTINTLSRTTQGQIGNFAYASWLGNLVSGQSCPTQSSYKSAYVNGNWKTISSSAYNDYLSQINTIPPTSESAWNIWVSSLKNSVAQAKLSKTFGSINSATSLSSAVVKITLQNQIQFPVTTLYIKADTIGIYTPTPEIKLVNADSSCFQTGEQGGINVQLQNIGNEAGTWNIYAQCQLPFISNSNIQVSLQPGQIINKVIPISASASSEKRASCTIYAESPNGIKQLTADVCVKPQITCTANDKFCAISGTSEVVKQCSSDGATSSIIEICSATETCEVDKCVSSGSSESIWDKIKSFFSNLFGGVIDLFFILKLIVVLIVFIFSMLFGKDLLSSFSALQDKEWLAWILASVIALGLGIFTYFAFWWGIITAVVFIAVRIIIKFYLGRR
ncbi:MAG: tripartite tricarboxylate transporter TctB family protein, partial [Nanoarchaeota archaeon]|nr:tripartite tricarboxylate transporter TctB family protein [Nanoarchaeota archaeon]